MRKGEKFRSVTHRHSKHRETAGSTAPRLHSTHRQVQKPRGTHHSIPPRPSRSAFPPPPPPPPHPSSRGEERRAERGSGAMAAAAEGDEDPRSRRCNTDCVYFLASPFTCTKVLVHPTSPKP